MLKKHNINLRLELKKKINDTHLTTQMTNQHTNTSNHLLMNMLDEKTAKNIFIIKKKNKPLSSKQKVRNTDTMNYEETDY